MLWSLWMIATFRWRGARRFFAREKIRPARAARKIRFLDATLAVHLSDQAASSPLNALERGRQLPRPAYSNHKGTARHRPRVGHIREITLNAAISGSILAEPNACFV
jgi:hypothetical protein